MWKSWTRRLRDQGTKALNRVQFKGHAIPPFFYEKLPKYDGKRCFVVIDGTGKGAVYTGENENLVKKAAFFCSRGTASILDGEWCDGKVYVFDCIYAMGEYAFYYLTYHRRLLCKKTVKAVNNDMLLLKTQDQHKTDGTIYCVNDTDCYYNDSFVKIPDCPTVDLLWKRDGLYACTRDALVRVAASPTEREWKRDEVWSFEVLSFGKFVSYKKRRDKTLPNDLQTVLLYVASPCPHN